MKNQWMAYVIVAVISALAGVAIAGPPNTVGTAPTIIVPETTTTTTLAPEVSTSLPADDDPDVETTTTTEPDVTTTTASGGDASADEDQDDTDLDESDLDESDLDDSDLEEVEENVEVDRTTIDVIAANGAATGGLATRVRNELRDLGFTQAQATDGTTTVDETVVYFAEGFAREGAEVAEALGLELSDMAPLDGAPAYGQSDDDQVVVYIGRDRA